MLCHTQEDRNPAHSCPSVQVARPGTLPQKQDTPVLSPADTHNRMTLLCGLSLRARAPLWVTQSRGPLQKEQGVGDSSGDPLRKMGPLHKRQP